MTGILISAVALIVIFIAFVVVHWLDRREVGSLHAAHRRARRSEWRRPNRRRTLPRSVRVR